MPRTIGIRREDKCEWERRVPITPEVVADLKSRYDIDTCIQPSSIRIISNNEFKNHGASIQEDLSACDAVFAVKEIPIEQFKPNGVYVFFSHVIKGQPYNMPMLRNLMDKGCTLIDYEKVTDDAGKRLIFFGRHAGAAGALETLYALGKRLKLEGSANPLEHITRAYDYPTLDAAKEAVRKAGESIRNSGLPKEAVPLVIGVAGYGNVGQGVLEVLDMLPMRYIDPSELHALVESGNYDSRVVYGVIFKEQHMVALKEKASIDPDLKFDCPHYFANPQLYESIFDRYWPHVTVLINAVYWDDRYPRLVTKASAAEQYRQGTPRLKVIGDVTCDVEGSIEVTVKSTEPGDPCYTYDPLSGDVEDDIAAEGLVIMAVDILPSELPLDASESFCAALKPYIPAIAGANYMAEFETLELPPEIKRAVIVHKGTLTPSFAYLSRFLV